MGKKVKILLVDDEPDIIEFLSYNLEKEGYKVKSAQNGHKAIEKARSFEPHLIILDIMMPGIDGIEVCEQLRADANLKNTLIAFLTARSESFTQIAALDKGGDDFITKPIKPSVFISKVKSLLRRHSDLKDGKNSIIQYGDLVIDFEKYKLEIKKKEIPLAKKEFELLELLTSKPGKVFKRKEILNKVWGHEVIVGDRTIDVHIRKLREKIGSQYIHTMKGVGYKFEF
jgi:two-component system alkaline phosphatase synthesis response regulator PhoP